LTEGEWDANSHNDAFDLHFTAEQIISPESQCVVFALMTRIEFEKFISTMNHKPSPKELYLQQWPGTDATTLASALKTALDDTASLVGPAARAVLDHTQSVSTISQADGATVVAPHNGSGSITYQPSPEAREILADIMKLVERSKPVTSSFRGVRFLATLPDGQLFFDSELQLDTDGWPGGLAAGDRFHQEQTSYRYASNKSINANEVPFFVLPLPRTWPSQFGIKMGDLAAVVFKNKLAFAILADAGPSTKLGEGSIELLRRLGQERLKNGRIINSGMGPGVVTIVFPGSGPVERLTDQDALMTYIEDNGRRLFLGIGGKVPL
jgi:hypothetical protein